MKKTIGVFIAILCFAFYSNAQNTADKIIGDWLTGDKTGFIRIYKHDGKYFGKIIGGNSDNTKDVKNKDQKLRNRELTGLVILNNFVFDDGEWVKGTIYDPNSGNTYKCLMWMKGDNTLEVKGYIGFSLLGRTETWTRINN